MTCFNSKLFTKIRTDLIENLDGLLARKPEEVFKAHEADLMKFSEHNSMLHVQPQSETADYAYNLAYKVREFIEEAHGKPSLAVACDAYVNAVKNNVDLSNIYTLEEIGYKYAIARDTITCVWDRELAAKYNVDNFCDSSYTMEADFKIIGQLEENAYKTVASDKQEM